MRIENVLCGLIFSFGCMALRAQQYEIIINDSLHVKVVGAGLVDSLSLKYEKAGYRSIPYYDFIDSLPDGKWLMYHYIGKKKKLYATGQYKNSLRNGTFQYYMYGYPATTYHYKNGVLHGSYIRLNNPWGNLKKNTPYEQGSYSNGKKHGAFIQWNNAGTYIRSIASYFNDTLGDYIMYYEDTSVVLEIGRRISMDSAEIIEYDGNGMVRQRVVFYQNRIVKHYRNYPNTENLQYEGSGAYIDFGENEDNYEKFAVNMFSFNQVPIDGTIINYNPDGSIGEIEIYNKGKGTKKGNSF